MRRIALGLFLALAALPAWAVRVDYTISVQPKADRIHVSALVREDPDKYVTMAMPVWIPGYYRRLDQYRGVSNLTATVDGAPAKVERGTPSTWRIAHAPDQPVSVDYDVRATEWAFGGNEAEMTLGQMGVYVGGEDAFVHPGAACVYVAGHTDAPSTLHLSVPAGWETAVPIPWHDGAYTADSYDALNDSPVQMGRFKRLPFFARDHRFDVIVSGKPRVSDETIRDVCRRVAEASIDLFQGWTPFQDYQFHLHFPPKRPYPGAGLEHRSSCVIVFGSRGDDATFRKRAPRMIAHEFLHAWNVKALRPEGLGPFNYQAEVHTPSLWLAEGVTDYLALRVAVRSGLWTQEQAMEEIAGLIDQYRGSPGRRTTSLTASSMGVWEASDPSSNGSGGTNYYTKGLLSALLLDIQVRAATGNRHSLDEAIRWMVRKYAMTDTPYPPDALLDAIQQATGVAAGDFYRDFIHGTSDLPLEPVLAQAGVKLATVRKPDLSLGAELALNGREPVVRSVLRNSAADDGHIEPGDVLLKVDGQPITGLRGPLLNGKDREIGDHVPITVRRGNEETVIIVTVKAKPAADLSLDPQATPDQKAIWNDLWPVPEERHTAE